MESDLTLEWMDPNFLPENPLNWRQHTNRQKKQFQALFDAVGWGGAILYNKKTDRIVNGHMRRQEAIKMGLTRVPVLVVSWSEEQEQQALLGLDSIGAMAKINSDALKSLTEGFDERQKALKLTNGKSLDAMLEMNNDLKVLARKIETKKASAILLQHGTYTPKVKRHTEPNEEIDIIFTSSNPYGIPDLLPTNLLSPEDLPRTTYYRDDIKDPMAPQYYCESIRPFQSNREGGVLGFFTEDWRFNKFYEKPAMWLKKLLDDSWGGLVQPDFSLYQDWPFSMNLWNLYRSRWVARFWQENGLKILPIVQNCMIRQPGAGAHRIGLESLPDTLRCFGTECRSISQNKGSFEVWGRNLRWWVDCLKPEAVLIYGGKEHQSKFWGYLPHNRGVEYILLPSYISKRRKL